MKKSRVLNSVLAIILVASMINPMYVLAANGNGNQNNKKQTNDGLTYVNEITPADRQAAAELMNVTAVPASELITGDNGYLIPDYFGSPNWAYSPLLKKFVDKLPGLGPDNANDLGQYIPIAVPDTETYPGSDYYEIAVVQYSEQMHSDLPATMNRGYVQLDTDVIPDTDTLIELTYPDGSPISKGDGTPAIAVDAPHYLGPAIISDRDRPVRIKFYNLLPTGVDGDLFIPVDTTVMGAGSGTMVMDDMEMSADFTQNRANIHLHGNNTVWISDGTPHQWITPAGEDTHYPQGVSVKEVPDMDPDSVSDDRDGTTTLYYTNSQSARLMFYHDHSYGITRLNVYSGAAAPYIIREDIENELINTGIIPADEIPLVIQDRTFVDANTILDTDPTWAWGTDPGNPVTGDLWYPHVYSPAQNPYDPSGVNPFGRWMYGPWFWPPTSSIANGPVDNPYYNPDDPTSSPVMPATPNPSAPGESFMDTPIVNGTAYPYLEVDPKAYRFRILNAANDRFFNLQMYVADDSYVEGEDGYLSEVRMVPATTDTPLPSHREQIIPDPDTAGPDWIQIGTEGGFLPAPAVIPSQPITWNLAMTAFNAGNIDQHSLLLGTAERADVVVDFSQYAGQTLILYNDAPAPFPASDPRYDYYTDNPDQTAEGGAPSTMPGYGPNIRTIMQIKVAPADPAPTYDLAALEDAFISTPDKVGVFEQSQEPIIIPQEAYNSAYGESYSSGAEQFLQLHDWSKTFQPISADGSLLPEVTLPLEPKAMQDEMGEVYDEYGRMSGFLGLTNPNANSATAAFLPYGYASPPVDILKDSGDITTNPVGTLADGTQIWKITHNGVDTHTIHTHLFSAQLVNRVAWDGAVLPPDANEIGWKETFRVNPLEHTFIAMRPKAPSPDEVPFDVPNSIRLIDPTMPEGAPLMAPPPTGWFDPQGNPIAQILNHYVNFGWEYVYHCHILSHEEMDMMHSLIMAVKPKDPTDLIAEISGKGNKRVVNLNWSDNSRNESEFVIERALSMDGPWNVIANRPADSTTYSDKIGNSKDIYYYRVLAANTVGDTETPGFPTVTQVSNYTDAVTFGVPVETIPADPTDLTATAEQGPQTLLTWQDNSDNESGFLVERADNGGDFAVVATVPNNNGTGSVSYIETTVTLDNTYAYRVAAINSAGQSGYTNEAVVAFTAITPPAAPSNFQAVGVRRGNGPSDRVNLTWIDNADNETGFEIERSTSADFSANLVTLQTDPNIVSFQTGNLPRSTSYYFRIRAINLNGFSEWVIANPSPVVTP